MPVAPFSELGVGHNRLGDIFNTIAVRDGTCRE